MAKFSVYVPDPLWEAVQLQARDLNMSHLVQDALRARLMPDDGFERPAASVRRLEKARDRLRVEAEKLYQRGYEAGVELGEQLRYADLEQLRMQGWRSSTRPRPRRIDPAIVEALESSDDGHPAVKGFTRAVRALWEAVSADRPATSAP